MIQLKNYIQGELVTPASQEYLPCHSPATGEAYCSVPDSNENDLNHAVDAAKQAFPAWSETPSSERARLLRKISEAIRAQKEDLAKAESIDTGKPFSLALNLDIARSAQNFEFFADATTQFSTECHLTDQTAINFTVRSPLGAVGCISPWNLPLYLLSWKIAPALAVGNTVVAKPSEVTPMTAYLLSKISIDAGLPPGVLNIVHGTGPKVGQAISQHPDIQAISFTGSTRTGSEIARTAAPKFKKLSLEMGGKNPCLIFSDADFDEVLRHTLRSAFSNQGQICLSSSRIFIERSLYSKFRDAFVAAAQSLKVGDPLEPETDQGAVVSQPHFEKILSYIDLAKQEGGRILTGGRPVSLSGRCAKGWFIAPTLIEGLSFENRVNQEEIFGPVATLIPFDSEEEVLRWANSTRYGLSANLWTRDIKRAHRFALKLHSGIVWVNCWMIRDLRTPFGGIKDSGVGREGGFEALKFFTEPKNVCINL